MHEELDPTRPWREVVGQNKDLGNGTALPGSRAHTHSGRRRPDGNGKDPKVPSKPIITGPGQDHTTGSEPPPPGVREARPGWHSGPPGEGREAAEHGSPSSPQGRKAPSRFAAYQDEDRLIFSTFIPGVGGSMSMPPPTYSPAGLAP